MPHFLLQIQAIQVITGKIFGYWFVLLKEIVAIQ
jgi:hypothetical protein